MNKIIIDNRSDLSDINALSVVCSVVREGRISNNNRQYCYYCTTKFDNKKYGISTYLNKKSDRFIITELNK